jgi:hypothetical protein
MQRKFSGAKTGDGSRNLDSTRQCCGTGAKLVNDQDYASVGHYTDLDDGSSEKKTEEHWSSGSSGTYRDKGGHEHGENLDPLAVCHCLEKAASCTKCRETDGWGGLCHSPDSSPIFYHFEDRYGIHSWNVDSVEGDLNEEGFHLGVDFMGILEDYHWIVL